ncbi:hypothetical protein GUITHDRAFT_159252 [Guillardia theta CCMP2712]|uniref:EF-hand domain-containing protein n=2 Tax=Guillardia theta TaxID=55529 RepID=L1JVU0_GUITC|nr:hypothetical protein GUITHDRAFT_159252 [Guillardia theta CCMP2712]EKX52502.1 hypothetical protein GUITHDRAFT_159252 [Guillardia theta CCMP2712]|eukprot:XP_005839482.1 hypothetical protein GUITHDRAFT_159252 [Guillardia theta CCMP2712]
MYGALLLKGANLISDGSELLLEVLDPGLIGGLLLPVLGALPDSAMIVMSGLGGTREQAKEQVSVGIGTLAGSTIMLLSIAWGGSLWVGRCDIQDGMAIDRRLTRSFDLTNTGVTTDESTKLNAYIMMASALLYLTPQIPTFMGEAHDPSAAGLGGILCIVALAAYCAFQVLWPELQKKKKEAAHKKFLKHSAIILASEFAKNAGTILVAENGELRDDALKCLFDKYDTDRSGTIERDELRKMMMILSQSASTQTSIGEIDGDLEYLMQELDADGDGQITFDEMRGGLRRWLRDLEKERKSQGGLHGSIESTPLLVAGADQEEAEESDDEEEGEEALTPRQIYMNSAKLMIGGTFLVALFSDPMVDAVSSVRGRVEEETSHIPAFFVSFLVTPFASNASELVSSLQFAKKKKKKNISLTYSQVYGAVTMNNTMCLGLFLLVVWYRNLDWNFSSEVVTTMSMIFALGVVACTRVTFPLYMAFFSLSLYPIALALVYFLDYVVGWQ